MSVKKRDPAERLAKLQEQAKAVAAEMKAKQQKSLASLGSIVAELLANDPEIKGVLLPKLQAVKSPRVKADIAGFITS